MAQFSRSQQDLTCEIVAFYTLCIRYFLNQWLSNLDIQYKLCKGIQPVCVFLCVPTHLKVGKIKGKYEYKLLHLSSPCFNLLCNHEIPGNKVFVMDCCDIKQINKCHNMIVQIACRKMVATRAQQSSTGAIFFNFLGGLSIFKLEK